MNNKIPSSDKARNKKQKHVISDLRDQTTQNLPIFSKQKILDTSKMKLQMNRFPKTDRNWLYQIKFDQSINFDDIWVDSKTLDFLNTFRD